MNNERPEGRTAFDRGMYIHDFDIGTNLSSPGIVIGRQACLPWLPTFLERVRKDLFWCAAHAGECSDE